MHSLFRHACSRKAQRFRCRSWLITACALLLGSDAVCAFDADQDARELTASAQNRFENHSDHRAAENWWTDDVWNDPLRPFLYYGVEAQKPQTSPAQVKKAAADPEKLPDFQSLAEVRAEYQRRLDAAVLNPTDDHLRALHAVQTWMLGKSHQFSQAFDRMRIAEPKFDWTAAHPSANFAAIELSAAADRGMDAFMKRLAQESGLVFVGSSDAQLNSLAIGPVRAFARQTGFELLVVAAGAPVPGDDVRIDNGITQKLSLTKELLTLPTVTLVPKPDAKHPALAALSEGRGTLLVAAGVPSMSELQKRLAALFAPAIETGNSALLTNRRAESMAVGDAWSPEALESLRKRFAKTALPSKSSEDSISP